MTDTGPRVTVLLPTYNAAKYVESAIQSLRDQTFDSFEILVVDDGSTDGTLDIVESFEDDRIRVIRRDEPAGGLPGALNRGLELARGEYVGRQDADDRSLPTRLARQVGVLDDDPSTAMVGTSAHLLDADGDRYETRIVPTSPTFADLLEKNHFVHGSVLFRRDTVLDLGGYDTAVSHAEDYDLWLRLAHETTVRNIADPLYELRLHDESVYGDQLRTVKLHAAFARQRALGGTDLTGQTLREQGVDAVYADLGAGERLRFHREMAQELLRYGRLSDARDHCRRALAVDESGPVDWGLLGLSYTHPIVVDSVVKLYRRVLNARARRHSA